MEMYVTPETDLRIPGDAEAGRKMVDQMIFDKFDELSELWEYADLWNEKLEADKYESQFADLREAYPELFGKWQEWQLQKQEGL